MPAQSGAEGDVASSDLQHAGSSLFCATPTLLNQPLAEPGVDLETIGRHLGPPRAVDINDPLQRLGDQPAVGIHVRLRVRPPLPSKAARGILEGCGTDKNEAIL